VTLTEHVLMESITKLKEEQALLEKTSAANEELAAEAIRQRDEYRHLLRELLATIHRDGGQHTESRGYEASCRDALEVMRSWWREHHEVKAERDRYRRGQGYY
jgi:hypothetical protein